MDIARKAAIEVLNSRSGGFAGIELKFLDSNVPTTALATTWTAKNPAAAGSTGSISVPAVGTGESERNGRGYVIKSIHIQGEFTSPGEESQAAPFTGLQARIIVYWDTQTNSAQATATDIMDNGAVNQVYAFRNLQNSRRFIVLFDKTIQLRQFQMNEGAANLFARGGQRYPFKFHKRFGKGIKVTCDGTTADVASVSDNNIGIAAVANSTDVSIEYDARIRFVG